MKSIIALGISGSVTCYLAWLLIQQNFSNHFVLFCGIVLLPLFHVVFSETIYNMVGGKFWERHIN